MYQKTHFKVLINSSKISKTCAHIIFLLNTRHDQEPNKIRTTTFGSIKLELSIFEMVHQNCEKQLNKQNKIKPNRYWWAGPRNGGPRAHRRGPSRRRGPSWAPAWASAADKADPLVSERNRGGATAGGLVRRRWLFWRTRRHRRVPHTHAHLEDPSIATIAAARGGGDEHGGARPRHVRLRRTDGDTATTGDSTSFGGVPMT